MKKNLFVLSALAMGAALAYGQAAGGCGGARARAVAGPAPTKIAIINITQAILGTRDGQAAAECPPGEVRTEAAGAAKEADGDCRAAGAIEQG